MSMALKILGFAILCITSLWSSTINSAEPTRLKLGSEARFFHHHLGGRDVTVDVFENHLDMFETQGVDYWILTEIYNVLPNLTDYALIGRARGLRNAYAFMLSGKRYIVHDPAWTSDVNMQATRYLIFGHEFGHHVCKHQIEAFRGSPWEKELEADRFSGFLMSRIAEFATYSDMSEAIALEAARSVFSEIGSKTHPPLAMRLAAITQGYNYGSPCMPNPPPGEVVRSSSKPWIAFNLNNRRSDAIQVQFYSGNRNVAWPAFDRAYDVGPRGSVEQIVQCVRGEQVCFGAWVVDQSRYSKMIYWGAGPNKRFGCASCCAQCDGQSLTLNFDNN